MGTTLVYSASAADGGERIHAMYAQTFLFAADYSCAVESDGVPSTATFTVDGLYARIYLAQSANLGTSEEDALELLQFVEDALGADWTVALGTDGYVRITFSGSLLGEIDWAGAEDIARLLGFTTSTLSFVADETKVAPYQPVGVMYSVSIDSTDWTATPNESAYAMTAGGVGYGWGSETDLVTKTVSLGHHPRTPADAAALGSPLTPMWPADNLSETWSAPTGPIGVLGPWTVSKFLATSRGRMIAAVFSNFQTFGAGSVYELGYQTPESIARAKAISPQVAGWRQRSRRAEFELSRVGGRALS